MDEPFGRCLVVIIVSRNGNSSSISSINVVKGQQAAGNKVVASFLLVFHTNGG